MGRRKLLWKKIAEQSESGDVSRYFPHKNVQGEGKWLGKGQGVGTVCTRPMSARKEQLITKWANEVSKRR